MGNNQFRGSRDIKGTGLEGQEALNIYLKKEKIKNGEQLVECLEYLSAGREVLY